MLPARRALVVGNSDGIGLALTRRLLADGWTVVGLSRRPSPVEAAGYRHAVADVAAPDYRTVLQALQTSEAPFDTCVFCAGIGELFNPDDLAREAEILRVNLVGAVETAAVVLPPMIAAGPHALPQPATRTRDLPVAHGPPRLAPRPADLAAPLAHARMKTCGGIGSG